MFLLIASAVATYIATSIDYLIILVILYAQKENQNHSRNILLGQYIGTGVLVAVSLIAAFGLHYIPDSWIIGFLGLIPIILGIRTAVHSEDDDESEDVVESSGKYNSLIISVAFITIASGGDNLGVYIPYFATLKASQLVIVVIIFAVLLLLLNWISKKLSDIKYIGETIEKYERIIVPIVFISLGIFILLENGTIDYLLSLL